MSLETSPIREAQAQLKGIRAAYQRRAIQEAFSGVLILGILFLWYTEGLINLKNISLLVLIEASLIFVLTQRFLRREIEVELERTLIERGALSREEIGLMRTLSRELNQGAGGKEPRVDSLVLILMAQRMKNVLSQLRRFYPKPAWEVMCLTLCLLMISEFNIRWERATAEDGRSINTASTEGEGVHNQKGERASTRSLKQIQSEDLSVHSEGIKRDQEFSSQQESTAQGKYEKTSESSSKISPASKKSETDNRWLRSRIGSVGKQVSGITQDHGDQSTLRALSLSDRHRRDDQVLPLDPRKTKVDLSTLSVSESARVYGIGSEVDQFPIQ